MDFIYKSSYHYIKSCLLDCYWEGVRFIFLFLEFYKTATLLFFFLISVKQNALLKYELTAPILYQNHIAPYLEEPTTCRWPWIQLQCKQNAFWKKKKKAKTEIQSWQFIFNIPQKITRDSLGAQANYAD